jgi:hypothetical protein
MGWLATIDSGVRIDSDIRRKIRESSSKPETKHVASCTFWYQDVILANPISSWQEARKTFDF